MFNLAGRENVSPDLFASSDFGPHFDEFIPRVEHGWPITFARREGISLDDAGWRDAARWNVRASLNWFSLAHLLANVALCTIGMLTIATVWQFWRKRRRHLPLQFHLGDLLVLTTFVALVLAADARDRGRGDRDRAVLSAAEELRLNFSSSVQERALWETTETSLLGRLTGRSQQRVVGIHTDGEELPRLLGLSDVRALHLMFAVTPDELSLTTRFSKLEGLDMYFVRPVARTNGSAEQTISPLVLPPLPRLRGLNLFGTDFYGDGLEHLTELEVLYLRETKVGDDALAKIGNMSRLQVLSLDETRITSSGLRHLVSLPKLHVLTLCRCKIDNSAAAHLTRLTSLQELDLRATSLDFDGGIAVRAALPTCRIHLPRMPRQ